MKNNNFLEIIIPGEPIAQPRHRVSFQARRIYDPLSNIKKKFTLNDSIISLPTESNHFFNDKPMGVEFRFFCGRPKSHFKKSVKLPPNSVIKPNFLHCDKLTIPDIDNYLKFYLDLFQIINLNGKNSDPIIKNDNLVINIKASKFYIKQDQAPETVIKLYNIV
jgi:Holliday junction resolvase RusA-like endonuclease